MCCGTTIRTSYIDDILLATSDILVPIYLAQRFIWTIGTNWELLVCHIHHMVLSIYHFLQHLTSRFRDMRTWRMNVIIVVAHHGEWWVTVVHTLGVYCTRISKPISSYITVHTKCVYHCYNDCYGNPLRYVISTCSPLVRYLSCPDSLDSFTVCRAPPKPSSLLMTSVCSRRSHFLLSEMKVKYLSDLEYDDSHEIL